MNLCRRSAIGSAVREAGIPRWASDIRPVRGRCRAKVKRRPCGSRWAIPRVSLDFRDPDRIDRLATLECASCGHVWRRISDGTAVRSREGYQAAYITLILPAVARRWHSRGVWHREGDDALVLRNADVADLDEAVDAHRARLANRIDARNRARAKREAEDMVAIQRGREALARLDALQAEREADEAAALAREAAY